MSPVPPPPPPWGDIYGGGSSIPDKERTPHAPAALHLEFPRTLRELKKSAAKYGGIRGAQADGPLAFKRWCLFVPHPLWNEARRKDTTLSDFIYRQRKGFGALLGPATLFLALLTEEGEVDSALAAQIVRSLGIKPAQAPLLIISDKPTLQIDDRPKKRRSFSAEDPVEVIIVRFGKATLPEVEATMDRLAQYMAKDDAIIASSNISIARLGIRLSLAAKNMAVSARDAAKFILPVIVAVLAKGI